MLTQVTRQPWPAPPSGGPGGPPDTPQWEGLPCEGSLEQAAGQPCSPASSLSFPPAALSHLPVGPAEMQVWRERDGRWEG